MPVLTRALERRRRQPRALETQTPATPSPKTSPAIVEVTTAVTGDATVAERPDAERPDVPRSGLWGFTASGSPSPFGRSRGIGGTVGSQHKRGGGKRVMTGRKQSGVANGENYGEWQMGKNYGEGVTNGETVGSDKWGRNRGE